MRDMFNGAIKNLGGGMSESAIARGVWRGLSPVSCLLLNGPASGRQVGDGVGVRL
jgi:hypothetical protein